MKSKKNIKPTLDCVFIERNKKRARMLKNILSEYDNCSVVQGDCNEVLKNYLNDGKFSFVYVDPFGTGEPTIRRNTLENILKRKNTELFLHYSSQAVSRTVGRWKECMKKGNYSTADSVKETLDQYIPGWQEVEDKKKKSFLELYEKNLRAHYENVEKTEIPINSKNPYYYLFFTTRNNIGAKIMKDIINRERKNGLRSLDEFGLSS